ncbi:hypothetical protein RB595_008279 [Gaeumannomyces hyphopodioides]
MWVIAGASRLLPVLLLILTAVSGLVKGQLEERALRFINKDWNVTRGRPFTIFWADSSGGTVSIFLFTKSPDKQTLALVDKLADTNEAQYTTTLPLTLAHGEYTFGVNDDALYYSPFFRLGSQDQSLEALATSVNRTTSSNSSTATPSSPTNSAGALQPTTPTQTPSPTTNPESTGAQAAQRGLTDGEKVGLGVGATLFVVVLVSVLGCLVHRVRKQTQLGLDDDDRTIVVRDPRGGGLTTAPRVRTNARGETRPPRRPGSVARSTHWARRVPSKGALTLASLNTYELSADPLGSPRHATPQVSQSRLASLREISPATPSVRTESLAELSAEHRYDDRE